MPGYCADFRFSVRARLMMRPDANVEKCICTPKSVDLRQSFDGLVVVV
jgi:hypothetical protein